MASSLDWYLAQGSKSVGPMSLEQLRRRLQAGAPQRGGSKGEGSVLGGLGRILGGDTD